MPPRSEGKIGTALQASVLVVLEAAVPRYAWLRLGRAERWARRERGARAARRVR